jgi:hypothetical protein
MEVDEPTKENLWNGSYCLLILATACLFFWLYAMYQNEGGQPKSLHAVA